MIDALPFYEARGLVEYWAEHWTTQDWTEASAMAAGVKRKKVGRPDRPLLTQEEFRASVRPEGLVTDVQVLNAKPLHKFHGGLPAAQREAERLFLKKKP